MSDFLASGPAEPVPDPWAPLYDDVWGPPASWNPATGADFAPPQPGSSRRLAGLAIAAALVLGGCVVLGGYALARVVAVPASVSDGHGQPPRLPPPPGNVVVDQAQAGQVLRQYWPVHERAVVRRDLATLSRLSAGPAREWEQSVAACGCLVVETPRPLLNAAYFVPRQTSYPASFITEAQTVAHGSYWAELLVFTKATANAPWLVTQDSGFGPPAGVAPGLGVPVTDAAGFDRPVTAAQHQRALTAAAGLAALWQEAKETGDVPARPDFELTGQTGRRVATLTAHLQDQVQAGGAIGHFRFYASPADPLIEVTDAGGSELACQVVRETVVYTPTRGHSIRQDRGHMWGQDLRPGQYRRITHRDLWATCFIIPPDGASQIAVLDHDVPGSISTGLR
ncbi:MAG: hypothetical protein JWP11_3015 [Frankiales bacterium]|nr:hypothetical protein [Frankiales bacterium]